MISELIGKKHVYYAHPEESIEEHVKRCRKHWKRLVKQRGLALVLSKCLDSLAGGESGREEKSDREEKEEASAFLQEALDAGKARRGLHTVPLGGFQEVPRPDGDRSSVSPDFHRRIQLRPQ